jgi:predicted sulfurtransferase
MRFILSFVLFTVFGFAQQSCNKETATTTANKPEVAKTNTNSVAANSASSTAAETAAVPEEAPRISLEDAKKAFDAGDVVFVDTRAEVAYKTEHIKGALNIPAEAFQTRYAEVPKNKKIIAYCS